MNKQIGSLILIAFFLCIGVQGVYAIGDEQNVDEWHNIWEEVFNQASEEASFLTEDTEDPLQSAGAENALDDVNWDTVEWGFLNSESEQDSTALPKELGQKKYKCDQCEYACTQKSHLDAHKKRHTGEKPYKCDECEYAATQKSHLDRHKRKHTGEKPYKCDECEYASTQKSNLDKHKGRNHTGEKPYKCDECEYAVTDKSELNGHKKRKHTGEKPYKCDECEYAATQKSLLNRHKRQHTGEKPYKCDECEYASTQKGNLDRHKRRNHTGDKQDKSYRTRGVHRFSPME